MRNKLFLIISSLLFHGAFPIKALEFPFSSKVVDQTYGDHNKTMYHEGIDMPGEAAAQTVKSIISSGIVVGMDPFSKIKGYVCVKDLKTQKIWVFGHIKPDSSLKYTFVDTTTVLGTLQRYPEDLTKPEYYHLHVALTNIIAALREPEIPFLIFHL